MEARPASVFLNPYGTSRAATPELEQGRIFSYFEKEKIGGGRA